MPLTNRENYMRNASMKGHEWIPTLIWPSGAAWFELGEELEDICLRHPVLFPGFRKGQIDYKRPPHKRSTYTDTWGCLWEQELDGLCGLVKQSPLEDWSALTSWRPPKPPPFDEAKRKTLADARAAGELAVCPVEHGFFLMRLYYLRGFDNFMMDVASDEPRLRQLAAIVADYWEQVISAYISAGIDLLDAGDDMGTQTASMLGPKHFRKWLTPTYRRLFAPARRAGAHVMLHTDGYIMDIIDEIIDTGVSICNPQDLVNGIDALAANVKGRVGIRLDIDRQSVLPFGSPADVRNLIREEVMKLGSPQGGLEFIVGLYPPTPARNIEALCSALEEFRTYWVGQSS